MSNTAPVVIVDDDEEDQEILTEVFKTLGIPNELKFFAEGRPVLDYLRTTADKPLIILTDINMPGMNGLELRAEICKDDYLRHKSIPFVFLTTSDGGGILQRVYEMQVQGFFQKASTFEEIKRQVQLIIDYWKECRHPNT